MSSDRRGVVVSTTERTTGSLKDRALVLRLDHDMSVRDIAARLNKPRSTVGGWLQGVGETRIFRDCLLCKETYIAISNKSRFCCASHASKHAKILGPLPATEWWGVDAAYDATRSRVPA